MRNSIGHSVILTLSGESHGEMICATLDGIAPGIYVDNEFIANQLSLRRPAGPTDTARVEQDDFRVVSGVFNSRTTGSPITILIPNADVRSDGYKLVCRPSHADYAAHIRYKGYEDCRGGGHFSGRLTCGIVAAGAIAIKALESKDIRLATHILCCGGTRDSEFRDYKTEIPLVNSRRFPVIDREAGEKMQQQIIKVKAEGDSIGGVIQTAVTGLECGLGEPWFDSVEGAISRAVFAIGGIKGIEFGLGFGFADTTGSEANDQWEIVDGQAVTGSNNNGGINGGLSNGMPVVFNCAVKPTPSIHKEQTGINLQSATSDKGDASQISRFTVEGETAKTCRFTVEGRHDPAIIRRICIVVTSITAIVMCDLLAMRHGTDWLSCETV